MFTLTKSKKLNTNQFQIQLYRCEVDKVMLNIWVMLGEVMIILPSGDEVKGGSSPMIHAPLLLSEMWIACDYKRLRQNKWW